MQNQDISEILPDETIYVQELSGQKSFGQTSDLYVDNGNVAEAVQQQSVPLDELISLIDEETTVRPVVLPEQEGEARKTTAPADVTGKIKEQYIRFFLDDILLAVPLASALEIGYRPEVTPLPNLPDWVLGISNIRGEIVSIVDLKGFFGLSYKATGIKRRIIIVHNEEIKVGLVVDRIMGIFYLDRSNKNIQISPYEEKNPVSKLASYISGVVNFEDNLLNMLDIEKLLSSGRMNAFRIE